MTTSAAILVLGLTLPLAACTRAGEGGEAASKPLPAASGSLPLDVHDLLDRSREGIIDDSSLVLPMPHSLEDAPYYATAGFRKATALEPDCVRRSLRLPAGLSARGAEPAVVKFAVDITGRTSRFEVLRGEPDPRLAEAAWKAIQGCRWKPGADAERKLVAMWVILPIELEAR